MMTLDRRAVLRLSTLATVLSLIPLSTRAQNNVASSTPPPIETYAASPLIDHIALSPDGRRIALVSQDGDNKILVYFDVSNGNPRSIIFGAAKVRSLFWADNDHVVIINSETTSLRQFRGQKQEVNLAQVLDLRTGTLRALFDQDRRFYSIVIGPVESVKINGVPHLMACNYRLSAGSFFCLFQFDLDKLDGRLVYEAPIDTEGFVIAPDGYVVAYSVFSDSRKEWALFYNTAPRGKTPVCKKIYEVKEALNYPSLEGLGRDGTSVVVYFANGESKGEYHEISADGTIGPSLDTSDYISAAPLFHPTTKRLAGFSHHDDWVTYDYTDPLLKRLADNMPELMGKESRVRIVDFAEDPRKMILYKENANDAGSYYFVDQATGDFQFIGSNYENLPVEWITQKKPITYKATDGLQIHAYLTLPPKHEAKNLPLIVLPHGGPQARDYIDFDWQTQALASRGYAVLQPNFRGSSGYGSDFVEAGYGQFGRKMQTDLSDGVRDLVRQGLVDSKRVAIMGASYGGYAALAGATIDPGVYRCAISIAGISDPKTFSDFIAAQSNSSSGSNVLYWKRLTGDPKDWDAISPVKQASQASCPVLLIHGTDDTVVPIDQSRRMESALKRAGKPVEFVTYKGQDHWETVGSSRIEMMKVAMAFLGKHNPA
ncbi:S9 family peptidase [Asticcacaulis sp. 201]|uniref:S9 family peptidase n=1 Tax=Asticcacaulis sp. 201 TaxID=3028787 RepID=UPI002916B473|nr:S9 family peptidase [Asticcacaulis sp. 201]MDV6332557.1 S9 family peptidase [Asticcacaulis sp. 201]